MTSSSIHYPYSTEHIVTLTTSDERQDGLLLLRSRTTTSRHAIQPELRCTAGVLLASLRATNAAQHVPRFIRVSRL